MFCGHIYFIVSKVNATIIDVEMFTEKQNNGDLEFKGSSLTTYVVFAGKKKKPIMSARILRLHFYNLFPNISLLSVIHVNRLTDRTRFVRRHDSELEWDFSAGHP